MKVSRKIISGDITGASLKVEPLTGLDLCMSSAGFDILLVYDHVLDEESLIDSLRETLAHNPYFEGRMGIYDGCKGISPKQEGILFTSIQHDDELSKFWKGGSIKYGNFSSHVETFGFEENVPFFHITHSIFRSNSVLGLSISHRFCDGSSFWSFMLLWSRAAKGQKPISLHYDRGSLNKKASHYSADKERNFSGHALSCKAKGPIVVESFRLPGWRLDELKSLGSVENPPLFSSQDLSTAYVWKLINSSVNLDAGEIFPITLVFNARKKFGLDNDYVGNAFFFRSIEKSKDEISRLDFSSAAILLRSLSNQVTEQSLCDDLAYFSAMEREGGSSRCLSRDQSLFLNGGLLINNWSKFPIYEIDFGSGKPIWFDFQRGVGKESARNPIRFAVIASSPHEDGCLDYYVGLPVDEMEQFREVFHLENNIV